MSAFITLNNVTESSHPILTQVIETCLKCGHEHVTVTGSILGSDLLIDGINNTDVLASIELHWSETNKQALWPAVMRIDHPKLCKGGITADDVEAVLAAMMRDTQSVKIGVTYAWETFKCLPEVVS